MVDNDSMRSVTLISMIIVLLIIAVAAVVAMTLAAQGGLSATVSYSYHGHKYIDDNESNSSSTEDVSSNYFCPRTLSERLPAFGFEQTNSTTKNCFPVVKSIVVHAPNCNEVCAGIRYTSTDPGATYTIEMFTDNAFHKVHSSTASCKLALLWEPPAISNGMYNQFLRDKTVSQPFHKIFTVDPVLIESDSKKFTRYLPADSWVYDGGGDVNEIVQKKANELNTSSISMIFSNKQATPGHRMRHTVWHTLQNNHNTRNLVYGCGEGAGNHVQNKTECLKRFRFTIVIENDKDQGYYFSEKLVDSFLMASVPLVWGNGKYLKEFFDPLGIIFWNTPEDLHRILKEKLDTYEKQVFEYERRLHAIKCNYNRSLQFSNQVFDRLVSYLVGPSGRVNCDVCPMV
jgi:hypothetical protein